MTDKSTKDLVDDDVTSEFSYVKSDALNFPDKNAIEQQSRLLRGTEPLTLSSIRSNDPIVKPHLEPLSSSTSPPEPPLHSPQFSIFAPPKGSALSDGNYRESYMSQISQYSGVPSDHAIPVTIKRHDSSKDREKSKLVYISPEEELKQKQQQKQEQEQKQLVEQEEQEHETATASEISEIDSENIKLGKLPTIRGDKSSSSASELLTPTRDTSKLTPDASYNTTIEGSVPPRSPRRPKSEILSSIHQQELAKEIANFNKNKLPAHQKSNSAHITDDLDELMKNIRRQSTTLSDPSGDTEPEPIDVDDVGSMVSSTSNILNNESTIKGTSSAEGVVPTDLPKVRSLPPRPSMENISRAREVSETVRNQQPSNENDDDFYDIGPVEVVHRPSRVKSVKDSTNTHHHAKKSKSAKKKKNSTTSSDLKPFSYHTLINLLESMNGTIIGEEFSQLNLPIKEKQLIEKIIDSLSRLTSDMVIDKSRYDIGIQRLEKALRVLEGFL
ncbi:uncharacterized protein RJT21DRAFT_120944 [Scheffersomyces amazonensis]|uniref:uncharacterized protein n=1 Tax=Scheffersomyces amazonensis TaxID=1078765 RepID=UPI00315D410A